MNNLKIILVLSLGILLASSCKKDTDDTKISAEIFNITLNANQAIPGTPGRTETGTVKMELFEDNTLEFTITVNNLASGDNLTASHIHLGDVLSTGGVFVGLVDGMSISFSGGTAEGTITLTEDQVVDLQKKENLYINVHSEQVPAGVVRGQIGTTISQSYNVALSSSVAGRTETGMAYIRVVDNTLNYKIAVNDLEGTDQIVASHIHKGAIGETGDVVVAFALGDNDQLSVAKTVEVDAAQLSALSNDALYINVHSATEQAGLIRGQIR